MEIANLLTPQSVIAKLRATSKKQALQDLARRAAEITGQSERAIFSTLMKRERLGTTGVGNGIAIPHGKLAVSIGCTGCLRGWSILSISMRSTTDPSISYFCCWHRSRRVPSTSRRLPGYRGCCATRRRARNCVARTTRRLSTRCSSIPRRAGRPERRLVWPRRVSGL